MSTQRSYYYNATTCITVWDRPSPSIGYVINLRKLQQKQAERESTLSENEKLLRTTLEINDTNTRIPPTATRKIPDVPHMPEVTREMPILNAQRGHELKGDSTSEQTAVNPVSINTQLTPSPLTSALVKPVVPPLPVQSKVPPLIAPKPSMSTQPLENFDEINQTRKVAKLFTKHVPLSQILSWSMVLISGVD